MSSSMRYRSDSTVPTRTSACEGWRCITGPYEVRTLRNIGRAVRAVTTTLAALSASWSTDDRRCGPRSRLGGTLVGAHPESVASGPKLGRRRAEHSTYLSTDDRRFGPRSSFPDGLLRWVVFFGA